MVAFVVANWILLLTTLGIFLGALRKDPALLAKPSIPLLGAFHVFLQWPATIQAGWIESYLPQPWHAILVVHGFVLGALALSLRFHRQSARAIWNESTRASRETLAPTWRHLLPPALALAAGTAIYLLFVPITETGLYSILFDPERASLAREGSLKLLENRSVAYLYFFNAKVSALLLASFIALWAIGRRTTRALVLGAVCLVPIAMAASLSGARSFGMFVLLAALATAVWARGRTWGIRKWSLIGAAFLALLAVPAILSILREGLALTPGRLFEYMFGVVLAERVFGIAPNAIHYIHYAQTRGYVGIDGWSFVAHFFGMPETNLSNTINRIYYPTATPTGYANAGFPFVYYAYVGLAGVGLAILLVQFLDVVLDVAYHFYPREAIPLLVVSVINVASLLEAEFTTGLVTHGIFTGAIAATALGAWAGWRR